MRKYLLGKLFLMLTLVCIFLPVVMILLWSFATRRPWLLLLSEGYSLRTVKEQFFGSASLPKLLLSSCSLAFAVGILGTVIGIMTARATEIYRIRGKALVYMGSFLPMLVPGTVFAMGIQITMIRLGLSDTVAGVIIVHLIAAVPYCITRMTDVTCGPEECLC